MILAMPDAADTDAKRLAFLYRALWRAEEMHRRRRRRYPAELSPAHIRKFKRWESTTWKRVLGRLGGRLNRIETRVARDFGEEIRSDLREASEFDQRWDDDIPADFDGEI